MLPGAGDKRSGEPLESATKARKSVAKRRMATPTSEKRRISSNASSTDSPSTSATPNNAPPPTYVDTICEIVGKWPGLDKRAIMREGEKLRELRHPGKGEEIVKSGFQNIFSTQSKKKNPRIQGWNFGRIDAEGRAISEKSTCRWLLAGIDPKGVQLWEAPSVPLAHDNHDFATARAARHDNNDKFEVHDNSSQIRRAAGTEEGEHTSEEPAAKGTQSTRGLPEDVGYHSILEGTTLCAENSNQNSILPHAEGDEITGERQVSSNEPVVRDESAEKNAFDEWSERAQGDYWGFQVRRKKNMLSKLRDAEGNLTKLSCRLTQLKESGDRDTNQLSDLQGKIQALRERIHQRGKETEQVHQNESIALEAASDLRKQIRDVDEKLDQYWAEED